MKSAVAAYKHHERNAWIKLAVGYQAVHLLRLCLPVPHDPVFAEYTIADAVRSYREAAEEFGLAADQRDLASSLNTMKYDKSHEARGAYIRELSENCWAYAERIHSDCRYPICWIPTTFDLTTNNIFEIWSIIGDNLPGDLPSKLSHEDKVANMRKQLARLQKTITRVADGRAKKADAAASRAVSGLNSAAISAPGELLAAGGCRPSVVSRALITAVEALAISAKKLAAAIDANALRVRGDKAHAEMRTEALTLRKSAGRLLEVIATMDVSTTTTVARTLTAALGPLAAALGLDEPSAATLSGPAAATEASCAISEAFLAICERIKREARNAYTAKRADSQKFLTRVEVSFKSYDEFVRLWDVEMLVETNSLKKYCKMAVYNYDKIQDFQDAFGKHCKKLNDLL